MPCLEEAGVDLVADMLAFDPLRRILACHALQHPYFASLRTAEAASSRHETPTVESTTFCSLGEDAVLATAASAATPLLKVPLLQF